MSAAPYLLVFVVPAVAALGLWLGGAFHLLTPLVVFGLIPALDLLWGRNTANPGESLEGSPATARTFRAVTWATVPVQLGLVAAGVWRIGASPAPPGLLETAAMTLSVGLCTGAMGITVAHELIHRHNRTERLLGLTLLWPVLYMHWAIEHVAGHHVHVSTPRDPATARRGESFWRFWPRTVAGGLSSAWSIERRRLLRRKEGLWSLHNRLLRYGLAQVGLLSVAAGLSGWLGLGFVVGQALVAFSLLEVVNYVEHYGLLRARRASGRYERVAPHHSWNSSERLSNWLLFNLQRHSDHHANPRRRYQMLRHMPDAPQLPTGYAGMLLLALLPPLWRRVMDPRVPADPATAAPPAGPATAD